MYEEGLFGTAYRKVDANGRIIIPTFADSKHEDLVLIVNKDDYLEVYFRSAYMKKVKDIKNKIDSITNLELVKYYESELEKLYFSVNNMVKVDAENRIMLGNKTLVGSNIVIVGADDCLRIYTEEKYNERKSGRGK